MRYEEYISCSEAIWFTSVPVTWRATKMRELFSEGNIKVSDKDYPALSVGKMGVVPQLDTAVKTDNGDNRKLICKGDFAINSRSDRKGAGGMSKYDGSASLIITVLKPHHELNTDFYHYLLCSYYFSEEFYRNGKGLVSDLWTTKWDEMRNIYIPVPPREELDPILDHCVEVYKGLTMEEQIEFKSCAKSFARTYNFLAAILPYGSVLWEKLAIFLNLLIPKLPSPEGEDYTEGLLEDVDLESYRVEAKETMQIRLENENGEINPIPVGTDVGINVPELDTLSNILKEFHDIFGDIEWTDADKIKKQVADLPDIVSRDETYQNAMRYSDKQNARAESDRATSAAILATMSSGIELYKEVQSNDSFRRWILDMVFNATYNPSVAARENKAKTAVYSVTQQQNLAKVAEPSVSYGKDGV